MQTLWRVIGPILAAACVVGCGSGHSNLATGGGSPPASRSTRTGASAVESYTFNLSDDGHKLKLIAWAGPENRLVDVILISGTPGRIELKATVTKTPIPPGQGAAAVAVPSWFTIESADALTTKSIVMVGAMRATYQARSIGSSASGFNKIG